MNYDLTIDSTHQLILEISLPEGLKNISLILINHYQSENIIPSDEYTISNNTITYTIPSDLYEIEGNFSYLIRATNYESEHIKINSHICDAKNKCQQIEITSGDFALVMKCDVIDEPTSTTDYSSLSNKPSINGVELKGNKTLENLGIQPKGDYVTKDELHSHNNKEILDGITSEKITSWDNKSNFSGSYNDLSEKPTIPTKTSELTNDSNYVKDAGYVHTDNNYTTTEKNKLAGLSKIVVDSAMSSSSTNPVQNKVVKEYIDANSGGNSEMTILTNIDLADINKPGIYLADKETTTDNMREGATIALSYIDYLIVVRKYTDITMFQYSYDNTMTYVYWRMLHLDEDGNTYSVSEWTITKLTETDPTVPAHVKNITEEDISKWNSGTGGGGEVSGDTLPIGAIVEFDGDTVPEGYEAVEDKVVTLYENSSGSNGTITLSETSANFKELEIFFRNNDNVYNSVKVSSPNGKAVHLAANTTTSGMSYHKEKTISITGTTIQTRYTNGYIEYSISSGGVSYTGANNYIYIIKVIGYR